MSIFHKVLAEMSGTFAMIFVGGASIILSERHLIPPICIPFAWGLIIGVMILAVGHISGAHFNPAVTFAFVIAKRIPANQMIFYWGSQLIGGVAAIFLLKILNR